MTDDNEISELTRRWGVYKYALANLKNARYVLGEFEDRPNIGDMIKALEAEITRCAAQFDAIERKYS